ncbi:MAG: hypothetical protein ACKVP0_03925 [Pirellulaceae bacterium]
MKRTWKQIVVGLGMFMGTTGACLAAEGHHRGGNGGGSFKPNLGGSSQMAKPRVQTFHPQVTNLQPKLASGQSGRTLNNNLGNSHVLKGNGISTMPLKPTLPIKPTFPLSPGLSGGSKSNKPLNIPGLSGLGGKTSLPGGIVSKVPLTPKFPGPITTLPCPVKPICPIKPICPPFPGPICGSNNNCNPWWGGWWYNPCTPIIIPIGCDGYGGYGGYVGGDTIIVNETVVVESPAQPAVIVNEVAPAAAMEPVKEPVKEEKLMQVPVGATLTLQGKELGDKPGQVLLQFEKFSFPAQVSQWKPDQVTTTLPQMGLAGPTKAQIFVLKDTGEVATTLTVELVPAVAVAK